MRSSDILILVRQKRPAQFQAQPGVSIDIHASTADPSTLGGMVGLRMSEDSEWISFGLTCFHSVYLPEEHRHSLKTILSSSKGRAFQVQMAFKNRLIGCGDNSPYFRADMSFQCSQVHGFLSCPARRQDGRKRVSSGPANCRKGPGSLCEAGREQNRETQDELVSVRLGRVYDPISGKEIVQETQEHAITGVGGPFSEPGESGSFVSTATGSIVVGVVIADVERKDASCITPIEDILRDTKMVTGAANGRLVE